MDGPEEDDATDPNLGWVRRTGVMARAVALVRGVRNASRAVWRRFLRRRPRISRPFTILITGATTGIGYALARRLLGSPHRLVLTARKSSMGRFAKLGIEASDRVCLLPLDVTIARERTELVEHIEARWGGVDVLVNNAGLSFRSALEHMTEADLLQQMATNYLGPMELTRLVLPHMRGQHFGKIVNVSSVGGMTAMPTMSAYSASKFALEGASESLWYEVRPFGVFVTLVRPGFVHSDGFEKVRYTAAGDTSLRTPEDPYHRHYLNMSELVEALMTITFFGPDDVAETIHDVIDAKNPPLRVAGTWDAHLFDALRRLLPARLYYRFLYSTLPRVWEWGELHAANGSLPPSARNVRSVAPKAPPELR
jgi:NAD(P)-dependent dehydrogenase (short-subunit alcohol dehydrogenase family)